jgi:hypothetical protein
MRCKRGVPFVYEGFDITDMDIWLYDRPSSVSRHRIIVDNKNKSTPKAIERIFWAKGLQHVLGVEQSSWRRQTKRSAVSDFGKEQDVLILDGFFLDQLEKSPAAEPFEDRLTEEQFGDLLGTYHPTKEGGDWKGRYKGAKRPLARDLGYNAINGWLIDAKLFAATGLIEQYAPEQRVLGAQIPEGLRKELQAIPTKILAEFFAKRSVSHDLFNIAKELEGAAYNAAFITPNILSAATKGILGVLLDFWEMDRKAVLQNSDTAKSNQASSPAVLKGAPSVQPPLPGIDAKEKH